MLQIPNRQVIRTLAWKSFLTSRLRNMFAVLAIILTSVLFTGLFTAAIQLSHTIEQQLMRSAGGSAHGSFKYLSEEQVKQFSQHPLVRESGARLLLAVLYEGEFAKHPTEVSYFDESDAKLSFTTPTTGELPDNKMELATDTEVLKLLGVEPKVGEKVTITYNLGDKSVTDTFTLSGYWEADEIAMASMVILSRDYVLEQLSNYKPRYKNDPIGNWNLDLMFETSRNIEGNLKKIAEDNGYQVEDNSKEHYIAIGVNWSYTSAQMENNTSMLAAVTAISLLIIFTGYLIIFSIFQISVSNDIRHYGLLKTIGTTGRQIKRIIRYQALLLTALGTPAGLLLGYLMGQQITPIIMSMMSMKKTYPSSNPVIFIAAAVFTVLTVMISVRKPGKFAARISPIEAVSYTEGEFIKKQKLIKKSRQGTKIHRIAAANILRNKKKAGIVVLSLSLSLILLNSVYVFVKGIDADKMVSKFLLSDFTVANSNYFNVHKLFRTEEDVVSESLIKSVNEQKGIENSGRIYFDVKPALLPYTQPMADFYYANMPVDTRNIILQTIGDSSSQYGDIQLYGMEKLPIDKLEVVEGKLENDKFISGNYILLAADIDDYDKVEDGAVFYHPGDKVELLYLDEYHYSEEGKLIIEKQHTKTYEVMAVVKNKVSWNVGYFGSLAMILPAESFINDTGTSATMAYHLDVEDASINSMERFIKNYTDRREPDMSYKSKQTYDQELKNFRTIFEVIGNGLSFIIGLVGILNLINVTLTGIITRRRELSTLRSIGMTGRQLISMLVIEGMLYCSMALFVSAVLSSVIELTVLKAFGKNFWFFTAQFSLLPIIVLTPILILLGGIIPFVSYKASSKHSIVEQLRSVE